MGESELFDAAERGGVEFSETVARLARKAGFPANTCGHCLGDLTGDHPRFCIACLDDYEEREGERMASDTRPGKVTIQRGVVTVDGTVIAERAGRWSLWVDRRVRDVRERTDVAWWRRAAEIEAATADLGAGGPLGAGVDYFLEEADVSFPPEVRARIQAQAYEAARDAILMGIDQHTYLMYPAVAAVAELDR